MEEGKSRCTARSNHFSTRPSRDSFQPPSSPSSAQRIQSEDMSSATQQDRLLHRKTATTSPANPPFSTVPLSARQQDSRLDKRDDDFATAQASSKATSLLDKVSPAPCHSSCSLGELYAPVPTWS